MKKKLIIVLDGTSIDYFDKNNTPNMYRMGSAGIMKTIRSQMPSVTNLNHASILSGKRPCDHKVIGNYYYNRDTGDHGYIESSDFMKEKTLIDICKEKRLSTAFLSVKGKVAKIFGEKADWSIDMENYDDNLLKLFNLEEPPVVDSLETYQWIFNACYQVIKQKDPDFVYCTTNDYLMHNYEPDTPEAKKIMRNLDQLIGKIYDLAPDREIYITADHGMNNKDHLYDLQNILDNQSYDTFCLLPLKDRYISNHLYQEGGTVYVHIKNKSEINKIKKFLESKNYVKYAMLPSEAEQKFYLPKELIGDLVIMANENVAFGELEDELMHKNETVRTHGSLYEREIPLIAVNTENSEEVYHENIDIFNNLRF